jgi:predicted enzyme related to lactoylglutathione lyase
MTFKEKKPLSDQCYICHIVIPLKNRQQSKTFYEKAFGWKIQRRPGTESLDILPPSGKGISGELNPTEHVVVPSIYTSNIDATLLLIEKFGGKKLKAKTPIGKKTEHGFFALFEDPNGNKMCLYSER